MYNARKFWGKCIKTILKQSFKDFRLILVNDGSSDGSGAVCDAYAKRDSRITVIHQENKGYVEARKTGILSPEVQGAKYITMVDADDTLQRNALELLYTEAEENKADYVCARYHRMWRGIPLPERYSSLTTTTAS